MAFVLNLWKFVYFLLEPFCVYVLWDILSVPYCYREEELQLKRLKQRNIKGNSQLSFTDDIENGSEEKEGENGNILWL